MNIIGICLTSDEGDVIARTLELALAWCDSIIVIDHDSSDATPKVLRSLEQKYSPRVHLMHYSGPFNNGIRSLAFTYFRELVAAGEPTWWCRLDSDEVYVDDPREFLAGVPRYYRAVAACSFQYYFTERDLERYRESPEAYRHGRAIDSLTHFACNSTELRFFRDCGQQWLPDSPWPPRDSIYPIFKRFIRLKHYQYRYPEQMQSRLDKRTVGVAGAIFHHETRREWLASISGQAISSHRGDRSGQENEAKPASWRDRVVPNDMLDSVHSNPSFRIDSGRIEAVPALSWQAGTTALRKIRRCVAPLLPAVVSR